MNIRKHNGLTLIGFLIVLVITLFFAYAAMRLVPMYLEYHALTNALSQLEKNPASANMSPPQIKSKIQRAYADFQDKRGHKGQGSLRDQGAVSSQSRYHRQV